jgi:hypothetical protein
MCRGGRYSITWGTNTGTVDMPAIAILWVLCVPYSANNGAGFCYDDSPLLSQAECQSYINLDQHNGAFCVKRYKIEQ